MILHVCNKVTLVWGSLTLASISTTNIQASLKMKKSSYYCLWTKSCIVCVCGHMQRMCCEILCSVRFAPKWWIIVPVYCHRMATHRVRFVVISVLAMLYPQTILAGLASYPDHVAWVRDYSRICSSLIQTQAQTTLTLIKVFWSVKNPWWRTTFKHKVFWRS